MTTRSVLRPLCLVCSLAILIVAASERPSPARPNYKKCADIVFHELFPKLDLSRANCNVCHSGDDKKKLNHFGKAVAEELGEKMVKDEKKIITAIKAVLKRKCKSGEWGERLERGVPPCDCGDQDAGSFIARQLNRDK